MSGSSNFNMLTKLYVHHVLEGALNCDHAEHMLMQRNMKDGQTCMSHIVHALMLGTRSSLVLGSQLTFNQKLVTQITNID